MLTPLLAPREGSNFVPGTSDSFSYPRLINYTMQPKGPNARNTLCKPSLGFLFLSSILLEKQLSNGTKYLIERGVFKIEWVLFHCGRAQWPPEELNNILSPADAAVFKGKLTQETLTYKPFGLSI